MSQLHHINYELIYFREGEKAYHSALAGYQEIEVYTHYGNEVKGKVCVPKTKASLVQASQAIINWACCVESCLNRLLFEKHYRNDMDVSEYKETLRFTLREKLREINRIYPNLLSKALIKKLLYLAKLRNYLVHFHDKPIHCGGKIVPPALQRLSKRNLMHCHRAMLSFAEEIVRDGIYPLNLTDTHSSLYGSGEIIYFEEDNEFS